MAQAHLARCITARENPALVAWVWMGAKACWSHLLMGTGSWRQRPAAHSACQVPNNNGQVTVHGAVPGRLRRSTLAVVHNALAKCGLTMCPRSIAMHSQLCGVWAFEGACKGQNALCNLAGFWWSRARCLVDPSSSLVWLTLRGPGVSTGGERGLQPGD
jgi:hypothetical protein